jgi:hypothetical protein
MFVKAAALLRAFAIICPVDRRYATAGRDSEMMMGRIKSPVKLCFGCYVSCSNHLPGLFISEHR